jgi:pilus assembly protein CpaB
MNTQRIVVLGIALVAAAGAAFMVRGLLGGGTSKVEARTAPPVAMSEVLVANANLTPGQPLLAEQVRWQRWPTSSVDPSFITHAGAGSEAEAVKGTVVRAPILQGQPIVSTALVHADAAGFMAAMLTPGMRAASFPISTDSGVAGFILPNDRVDVILTRKPSGEGQQVISRTILSDVRVLAVDQTFKQEKDTKTLVAKTATVEVMPDQAEKLSSAQSAGSLSLTLRPLGDNDAVALNKPKKKYAESYDGPVEVIRYGVAGAAKASAQQEKAQ